MCAATWEEAAVLGGFLPRSSFEPFVEEARKKLTAPQLADIWKSHREAVSFVRGLTVEDLANVGESPLAKQFSFREEEIRNQEEFREIYEGRTVRFATVRPTRLAVFQFQVRIGGRPLSAEPSLVLDECLPKTFNVEVDLELLGNPSTHSFQVTATTDTGNVFLGKPRLDHEKQLFELPFLPNRNWVQVAHFAKRYWIHNGYHRIYNLIALGVDRIPCIVYEAEVPVEVVGNVIDLQSFEKLRQMKRPPLMMDFFSKTAIKLPRRRHRRMLVVTLQVGSEQVPV